MPSMSSVPSMPEAEHSVNRDRVPLTRYPAVPCGVSAVIGVPCTHLHGLVFCLGHILQKED